MVRAISRRSRAARRGEIDPDDQDRNVKSLDEVPRAERTDVIGPMIRASLEKNEMLLTQKIPKKYRHDAAGIPSTESAGIHKKRTGITSKTVRSRRRRAAIVDGRLSTKIEASIMRTDARKRIRKANWDKVNEATKESIETETHKMMVESELVKKDENSDVFGEEGSGWAELTGKEPVKKAAKRNAFDLLEEVEA